MVIKKKRGRAGGYFLLVFFATCIWCCHHKLPRLCQYLHVLISSCGISSCRRWTHGMTFLTFSFPSSRPSQPSRERAQEEAALPYAWLVWIR